MMFFPVLLALPALAAAANSHHIDNARAHGRKRLSTYKPLPRAAGAEFSNYEPGLGACGGVNGPNDYIVALSAQSWDGGSHCGEQVSITVNGKTASATIVDECMGCHPNKLDLSPGLFKFFGNLDDGILHGSFSSGADKKADEEAQKKKQAEEDAKKKADEEAAQKKAADEEAAKKKQEEEDAQKKKAEEDAAKSKSAADAAARTSTSASSSSSAASSSSSSSSSAAASSTKSAAAAAATTAATVPADTLSQVNLILLQMAGMGVMAYKH